MAIELEKISYKYQKMNYSAIEVLKDVDMTFLDSKITSIIGNSKTTILEIIAGNIKDYDGKIIIDNDKISYVSDDPKENFIYDNIYEELLYTLEETKYSHNNYYKRILDALLMVDLDSTYLKRNISTLSSSEFKKFTLARALISNPNVLLLDNISSDLDQKNLKLIIKLLRMLKNRYHKTIIIASSDIEFVHQVSDYIYVINNTKVALKGNKYDVFKQVTALKKYGIKAPNTILFSDLVLKKKKIKLGYRDDINDLIKDIYRFVK